MKRAFRLFALFALLLSAAGEEISIGLMPERELGSRHPDELQFRKIEWSADSPWFHKPAPVCKVARRPMDLSRFREEAERRDMVPETGDWGEHLRGKPGDGSFNYVTRNPPLMGAGGNPRTRYFFFGVAPLRQFERDEHQMAVVKPLATREESVAICREWMKKLGIDENEFSRQGDWPEGFEVNVMNGRVSRIHPVTKENVIAFFGQQLRFIQQIGGLPAYWSGYGGNVMFEIGHGGKFCSLIGCLRAWEKIGDYEVLDRAEIETALTEGFAWVFDPIDCEKLEVVKVELAAYHSGHDAPQVDFPLIYTLHCKLHGGRDDGEEKKISLPALRQHRDKYGPSPELTGEEKQFKKRRAEEEAGRRENPPKSLEEALKEMTPEELEEFNRRWIAAGGTITPPPDTPPTKPEKDKSPK